MSNEFLTFTSKDIEIIDKKRVYDGFFKMVRYDFKHKLFAGGWSDVVRREIFERGHAVAVLPYDPDHDEFVLIEQVRIGAQATADTPWLMEVIAGIIDEGETEENVCHREAQEEAGIRLTKLTKALSYLVSPGGTTERVHIFVAQCDASLAKGIHGLDDESEDIRVHRISSTRAREWLESGIIDNAAAIIALQWFFMNRESLLQKWRECE
ncbi:ADP-ribose diphosphatase [Alteromonas ponticola]|uniref:ADP-ribose pyrophosphatase n=1 Tax=Alteromonas aquimaris TaxID=2998417 RepID=A0ABT3P997_9ALTE|nr:ADP-ribose diphosphatase [Alteromonas aquimaris]MCW8109346.1 ADP-ribose diphosphatase [Alteromonas aquimaris]